MYNTATSINIHPHGDQCPEVSLDAYDTPMNFTVFKIKSEGNEINIFFTSDSQRDQFIDGLKVLILDQMTNV